MSSAPLFESPVITQPAVSPICAGNQASLQLPQEKHSPIRLVILYATLFFSPIALALGINAVSNTKSTQAMMVPVSQEEERISPSNTSAKTAVLNNTPQSTEKSLAYQASSDYQYEISLANSFLVKAVALSNASATQTEDEKTTIVQYLTQALEAANRAVAMQPDQAATYNVRGRVYQALAVVQPEMREKAEQDLAQAKTLESSSLADTSAAHQTTVVAAPEETKAPTTVQTDTNTTKGTVTLPTGETDVFVAYPSIQDSTQLYVTAERNPDQVSLYVKNKQAGKGFTISSTAPSTAPVEITWWEIL